MAQAFTTLKTVRDAFAGPTARTTVVLALLAAIVVGAAPAVIAAEAGPTAGVTIGR